MDTYSARRRPTQYYIRIILYIYIYTHTWTHTVHVEDQRKPFFLCVCVHTCPYMYTHGLTCFDRRQGNTHTQSQRQSVYVCVYM